MSGFSSSLKADIISKRSLTFFETGRRAVAKKLNNFITIQTMIDRPPNLATSVKVGPNVYVKIDVTIAT